MHQSLSNFESDISLIDVAFSIEVSFLRVVEQDDFKEHYLQIRVGTNDQVSTLTKTLIQSELNCLMKYSVVPNEI